MIRAAAATLALMLAFSGAAAAQSACPGHISSTAIAPVPQQARIGISLRDNSPRQERLREAVYALLRSQGRPVGDPPALVMSWRGGLANGGPAGGMSSADVMFNQRDQFRDSDDLSWMQDVPRTRRRSPTVATRLSGTVELRDVATGRVVWTAVFSCDRQASDDAALIRTLAGAVVPILGQTVSARPF